MKNSIGIDSSQAARQVVDTVAASPWPYGAVFCVMSIVDLSRWEELPTLIEDAKHAAQSAVKYATDKLIKAGHEVSSEIQLGFPKKAIPEYAKEWGADLLVIGSHGQSALIRFLLGSVAHAVLRTSPCSVEIVRPGLVSPSPSQGMKILLATDGSSCSAKAVYSVANRPWPAKSQIGIVSVVQLLIPEVQATASPFCAGYPTGLLEQMWKEARTRAETAVVDARKTLSAMGLNVCDRKTPEGEPRSVILDEAKAWGADLIVLGSHGLHGLAYLLIGSVSESVALYAQCSVEVVR